MPHIQLAGHPYVFETLEKRGEQLRVLSKERVSSGLVREAFLKRRKKVVGNAGIFCIDPLMLIKVVLPSGLYRQRAI